MPLFPREHGVYAQMILPLVTSLAVAGVSHSCRPARARGRCRVPGARAPLGVARQAGRACKARALAQRGCVVRDFGGDSTRRRPRCVLGCGSTTQNATLEPMSDCTFTGTPGAEGGSGFLIYTHLSFHHSLARAGVHARGSQAAVNASTNSSALCGLSSGDFARQLRITASSAAGTGTAL